MKNIVSTIIVFGSIFILIVAGAFVFDKFNGFGLIDNVDSSLSGGIKKVLESEEENLAGKDEHKAENRIINNNISDNTTDNSSDKLETMAKDNSSDNDNKSENIINDKTTIDNQSILQDNKTIYNTPSDNTSDGISI